MRYREWVEANLLGHEWLANGEVLVLCPYHENTESPACCVNVEKGLFICYSCGAKGSLMKMADDLGKPFVRTIEVSDVRRSAARTRSHMDRADREPASEPIGRKSERWLAQFTQRRHPYWKERGITDRIRREWQLGYDRGQNAVTIPLHSLNGSIMGVVRRFLDPEAPLRYRYPVGFKRDLHLFAAHRFSPTTDGDEMAVVVEGAIDCIRVWMAGFPCVALLGDSLSNHQRTLLGKLGTGRIHVFMDNDGPGRAAQTAVESSLMADGYDVLRVRYPQDSVSKDPGGMTLGRLRWAVTHSQSTRQLQIRNAIRKV